MIRWTLAMLLTGTLAFWSVGGGDDYRGGEPGSGPGHHESEREPGS